MVSQSSNSSPDNSGDGMVCGIRTLDGFKSLRSIRSPGAEVYIASGQEKPRVAVQQHECAVCFSDGSQTDATATTAATTTTTGTLATATASSTPVATTVPISSVLMRAVDAGTSNVLPPQPSAANREPDASGFATLHCRAGLAAPATTAAVTAASAPHPAPLILPQQLQLHHLPAIYPAHHCVSPVTSVHGAAAGYFTEPITIPGALHVLPLVPEDALPPHTSPLPLAPFPADAVSTSPPFRSHQPAPLVLGHELPDESVHGGMLRHSLASASGSGLACVDWVESCCASPCPSLPTTTALRYSASMGGAGVPHSVTTWSLAAQLLAAELREQQQQQQPQQQPQQSGVGVGISGVGGVGGSLLAAGALGPRRRSMDERGILLGYAQASSRAAAGSTSARGLTAAASVPLPAPDATAASAQMPSRPDEGGVCAADIGAVFQGGDDGADLPKQAVPLPPPAVPAKPAGLMAAATATEVLPQQPAESDVKGRRLAAMQLAAAPAGATALPTDIAVRNAVCLAPTSFLLSILLQRLLVACVRLPLALTVLLLLTPARLLLCWREVRPRGPQDRGGRVEMVGRQGGCSPQEAGARVYRRHTGAAVAAAGMATGRG